LSVAEMMAQAEAKKKEDKAKAEAKKAEDEAAKAEEEFKAGQCADMQAFEKRFQKWL